MERRRIDQEEDRIAYEKRMQAINYANKAMHNN